MYIPGRMANEKHDGDAAKNQKKSSFSTHHFLGWNVDTVFGLHSIHGIIQLISLSIVDRLLFKETYAIFASIVEMVIPVVFEYFEVEKT